MTGPDDLLRSDAVNVSARELHDTVVSFFWWTVSLNGDNRVRYHAFRNRNSGQVPDETIVRVHVRDTGRNVADLAKNDPLLAQCNDIDAHFCQPAGHVNQPGCEIPEKTERLIAAAVRRRNEDDFLHERQRFEY